MGWTTPRTWTGGEFVEPDDLNEQLRDNLNAIVPIGPNGWTAYTPTLTQSGTVTKTVTYASYMKVGRMVTVSVLLSVTGTGTASNAVLVSLPFTAVAGAGTMVGTGVVFDASAPASHRAVVSIRTGSTQVQFEPCASTVADVLGVTTFTTALASGDIVKFEATYESTT